MKNIRKFLLLIIVILIFCLIFTFMQIYAKYISSSYGTTSMNIANWNIKVNNSSIKNSTSFSNTLMPFFPGDENIAPNIIAPTAKGYVDLVIDYSEADVSFKYEISSLVNPKSSVSDLVITSYCINDGPIIELPEYNSIITDNIPLLSTPRNRKIRLYILWNDNDLTQNMPNSDDTLSANSPNPALMDFNITFTQIVE